MTQLDNVIYESLKCKLEKNKEQLEQTDDFDKKRDLTLENLYIKKQIDTIEEEQINESRRDIYYYSFDGESIVGYCTTSLESFLDKVCIETNFDEVTIFKSKYGTINISKPEFYKTINLKERKMDSVWHFYTIIYRYSTNFYHEKFDDLKRIVLINYAKKTLKENGTIMSAYRKDLYRILKPQIAEIYMKENNLIQDFEYDNNKKEYYNKINKFMSEEMDEDKQKIENINNYIIKAFNSFDYGDIEILNIQKDNRDESLKKYNNEEVWTFKICEV